MRLAVRRWLGRSKYGGVRPDADPEENSFESGTSAIPESSQPDTGSVVDPETGKPHDDVELGTDMTAVETGAFAEPLNLAQAERATLIELCVYAIEDRKSVV